jgi:hypothetical protein
MPPPSTIEVHVRELAQLFESLDPSPFREQDLAPSAEEYIVDSAKELPRGVVLELRVYVDQEPPPADARTAESAIRAHFARRTMHLRRSLQELLGDGVVSLVIGLTVLIAFFVIGQAIVRMRTSAWATLARESFLIGGWVAMWRPLEILLYLWWPVLRERRLYQRLANMDVRVTAPTAASARP